MNPDVSFAFPQQLSSSSNFTNPAIAVNSNDDCIMVYNSGSSLSYSAGALSGCYCKFGKSKSLGGTIGYSPSISLNNSNNCMLAYGYTDSGPNPQTVVIDLCTLKKGTISIITSSWLQVTNATQPSVSLNNNNVFIEVHQNPANGQLYYILGTVTNQNGVVSVNYINKTPLNVSSQGTNVSGSRPAVAINDSGQLILFYTHGIILNYIIGTISSTTVTFGESLTWGSAFTGYLSISAALANNGDAVITYVANNANPDSPTPVLTFYKVVVNIANVPLHAYSDTLLSNAVSYANVATALNNTTKTNITVMVQQQSAAVGSCPAGLYYTGSYLMSRANWMGNSLGTPTGSKQLRNIVIPASHDASMYTAQNCTTGGNSDNTITQTSSIAGQLNAGIRYFDIRPIYQPNSTNNFITGHFFHGHGCYGPLLSAILNDVSSFISANNELVILKFSHIDCKGVKEETVYEALISQVTKALGSYYYKKNPNPNIATTTLNTFLSGKTTSGIVLPVFGDIPNSVMKNHQGQGIYSYADYELLKNAKADLIVYDDYSGTPTLSKMITDQSTKMLNTLYHPSNGLFLLSWTLTRSKPAILTGAFKANQALWPNIVKNSGKIIDYKKHNLIPNFLYIDACEGFVTDVAFWLNTLMAK